MCPAYSRADLPNTVSCGSAQSAWGPLLLGECFLSEDKVKMGQNRSKSWPARLPIVLEPPAVSLWDCLAVSARRHPEKSALVFFDRRISYIELLHAAERLAARLVAFGVQSGDRVLVVMQNCPQLIIAHYAIVRANAV